MIIVRKHSQEEQFAALYLDLVLEGDRAAFRNPGLREDAFRRCPTGLELLDSGLPSLLSGCNLGRLLSPLLHPSADFRRW